MNKTKARKSRYVYVHIYSLIHKVVLWQNKGAKIPLFCVVTDENRQANETYITILKNGLLLRDIKMLLTKC